MYEGLKGAMMMTNKAKSEDEKSDKTSTIKTAVIAGVFTLLGSLFTVLFQGWNSLELKQKEFESAVILKAIETGDPEKSAKNLAFLIRSKVLEDKGGQLEAIEKNPEQAPVLPASSSSQSIPTTSERGLQPRVYMSIPEGTQTSAKPIIDRLESLNYIVRINVRGQDGSNRPATVSFYHSDDEEEAKSLIEAIKSAGVTNIDSMPKRVSGAARPRHYDVRLYF